MGHSRPNLNLLELGNVDWVQAWEPIFCGRPEKSQKKKLGQLFYGT
jgi:hypothetical protein